MSKSFTAGKLKIVIGTGDVWGVELSYYHPDRAIVMHLLCWYLIIEKNYPYEQHLIYSAD